MARGTDGPPLYTRLLQKLEGDVSPDWLSRSIFKVPNHLRRIGKQAYEPQVISIGPYHHGKAPLKKMEVYKMFNLKKLLERTESNLERYTSALKDMEEQAREFYSEPLNHIGGENFVEMMLLDGCFVIELIRNSDKEELRLKNDHLLTHFILRRAMLDLLLVENQLPFFILSKLFDMTVMPNDRAMDLVEMTISFFSTVMPGSLRRPDNQDIKHLLGLLHDSSQASSPDRQEVCCFCLPENVIRSLCHEENLNCCSSSGVVQGASDSNNKEWRFISSATELNEAGINFKKIKGKLFDIKFQKGVMSIPTLSVNDDTESILRNLVAYEQCFKGASSKCFTDYLALMDCLINTGKDVELLCLHGVIDNWLGDHEVVATLFNKLRDSVSISKDNFSYAGMFIEVNKHCKRKWNLWKANLWHNYFNTPWASISFIFAVFWLLLTVLDTVFEIRYYFRSFQNSQNISPDSSPY